MQIYDVDNMKGAPLDVKPLCCAQPAQMYMVAFCAHTHKHINLINCRRGSLWRKKQIALI